MHEFVKKQQEIVYSRLKLPQKTYFLVISNENILQSNEETLIVIFSPETDVTKEEKSRLNNGYS